MSNVPAERPMQTHKAYWLPPHVRACSTSTGTVLLDLRRNRYFGVGRKETKVLSSLAENWHGAASAAMLDPDPLPLEDAARIAGCRLAC
jgi:hypothetical protein